MTITRADVADLRKGDVVELRDERWPEGTVVRGAVHPSPYGYLVGPCLITNDETKSLTVVSRAPRLYVNHGRTEPVAEDVATNARGDLRVCQPTEGELRWWGYGMEPYGVAGRWTHCSRELFADNGPLILLVDGETGLPPAVQS